MTLLPKLCGTLQQGCFLQGQVLLEVAWLRRVPWRSTFYSAPMVQVDMGGSREDWEGLFSWEAECTGSWWGRMGRRWRGALAMTAPTLRVEGCGERGTCVELVGGVIQPEEVVYHGGFANAPRSQE